MMFASNFVILCHQDPPIFAACDMNRHGIAKASEVERNDKYWRLAAGYCNGVELIFLRL